MADYSYGYKCVNNMAAGPKTLRKSPDPTQHSGWGLGTRLLKWYDQQSCYVGNPVNARRYVSNNFHLKNLGSVTKQYVCFASCFISILATCLVLYFSHSTRGNALKDLWNFLVVAYSYTLGLIINTCCMNY